MSSSSELVDSSGQTAEKMPEKSSFSQRCSLLSQYLKVKGGFGDLSLGMTCNSEGNVPEMYPQTMNLFPTNEIGNQFDVSTRNMANPQNRFRSMDLFPQQAADVQKRVELSNIKPAASDSPPAQMTIFYNGQVIVFDDFPADKAKEVMLLAGKGSSQNQSFSATCGFPCVALQNPPVFSPNLAMPQIECVALQNPPVFSPNLAMPQIECSTSIPQFGNNLFQDRIQSHPKPITTDLPIARRASLHRFLEKRKDRIISRAPYTMNESKSWLGLAAQFPVAP